MTVTKMHFVIGGEWLTEFSRTRWADEGAPFHAVRVLESGFPMFGLNTIMKILTGSLKLTGDSTEGLLLVEDNANKSRQGNPLSFSAIMNVLLEDRLKKISADMLRPIITRYCDAVERDEMNKIGYRELRKMSAQLQEAVDQKPPVGMASLLGTDENVNFMMDFMSAQSAPIEAKIGPVKDNWCGWIKPNGDFYPCRYYQHDPLAVELGFANGDEMLKRGWMKIQEKNQGIIKKPADFYWEKKPSQKQIDKLWDWCQANNRTFPQGDIDALS